MSLNTRNCRRRLLVTDLFRENLLRSTAIRKSAKHRSTPKTTLVSLCNCGLRGCRAATADSSSAVHVSPYYKDRIHIVSMEYLPKSPFLFFSLSGQFMRRHYPLSIAPSV